MTLTGGNGTDTIQLIGDSQTIVDADFTNVTLLEKLITANGANNLTLGTNADDSVLATVTGGTGADTIDASAFTAVLTISSGAGNDVITTQAGALNLSVVTGVGDDSISVVGANLAASDSIDGGADIDTITLSADAATIIDADFTNVDNVEKLTTANGANSVTIGTKAADTGIATVTGGGGVDTIDASGFDAVSHYFRRRWCRRYYYPVWFL